MLFSEKKSANNEDKCHIFVNFFKKKKKVTEPNHLEII